MANVKLTPRDNNPLRVTNAINKNATYGVFASANFTADNRLIKTDRPTTDGKEVQQTGITVDDSDNVTMGGRLYVGDGATATPVIAHSGDEDTGIFFPAANTFSVVTSATERLRITDSGLFLLNHHTTINVGGNNSNFQGHSPPGTAGSSNTRWSSNAAGPAFASGKSRSTTIGSYSKVLSNDSLGSFLFAGDDGADLQSVGAEIRAQMSADATADSLTTRIDFRTANAAATPTSRLTIEADGSLTHRNRATTVVSADSHLGLRSYTVATLPSAATSALLIYVSDGTSNKRLAVSDGTNWRFPDGAIVS